MKPVDYPDDCMRIQKVANRMGYDLTLRDAEVLWERHSDDHAAGWLFVREDDDAEIEGAIREYFGL